MDLVDLKVDLLLYYSIHFVHCKKVDETSSKTVPEHDAAIIMLDSWYNVRRFASLTCPYPNTPLVILIKLFAIKYLARSCP